MQRRFSRAVPGALAVLFAVCLPAPSHGQQTARRLFTIGADDQVALPNVRAAAAGSRTVGQPHPRRPRRHAPEVFEPMGTRRAVVRLRGTARDTVLAYDVSGERIRLTPATGPSFTVVAPFHATPQWTDVPGASIAVWVPEASHVEIRDLRGTVRQRFPVPSDRIAVETADREWWFADAIPAGRELLALGDGVALARALSADGEPIVEGWALP